MKIVPQLRDLTAKLRTLERTGFYQEAFESLSDYWCDITDVPDIKGLSEREAADLLLRCGTLAGLLGRLTSVPDVQENSKNLITNAREIYLQLEDEECVVEAENGLALAYMRKGEYCEATAWIDVALSHDLPLTTFVRLESFICKSLILVDRNKYEEAQSLLQSVAREFEEFDDDYLNGCFATNLGLAEKYLGNPAGAMQMLSLARYYHQKSGHLIYLATVENNMAYLYQKEGRYDIAYDCLERAKDIFQETGDISRLGSTIDSEAEILMMEGRLEEALEKINLCLEILRPTEFVDLLIEGLVTKMKILMAMGNIAGSVLAFNEAAVCASAVQGEKRVESLAEEFDGLVRRCGYKELGRIYSEKIIKGEELELELPSTLANYDSFDAVWINNRDLESAGLFRGGLALVVDADFDRGSVVALVEHGSDEVICGYCDRDFGIIAISNDRSAEPQIFAEESVEILGKIVGFADPSKCRDGKLKAQPLRIV